MLIIPLLKKGYYTQCVSCCNQNYEIKIAMANTTVNSTSGHVLNFIALSYGNKSHYHIADERGT